MASGRLPPGPREASPSAATAHSVSCTASTLGLWLDASIIILSACYRPAGSCPAVKAMSVAAQAYNDWKSHLPIIAHPLSWLAEFPILQSSMLCPGNRKNVLVGSDMKLSRFREADSEQGMNGSSWGVRFW